MTSSLMPVALLLLGCIGRTSAADVPDGLPHPSSMADAMKDPAVIEQAMKMMQNPMVMQQMRVMMQDPRVKERMQRMLERLGGDSGLDGASTLANDPAALDKLFERMQAHTADAPSNNLPFLSFSTPSHALQRRASRNSSGLFVWQDPSVLEKVAALAKNETFQAKVRQLAQTEKFVNAAGEYADELKDDIVADAKLAQELGLDESLQTGDEEIDEGEDETEDGEGEEA